MTYELFTSMDTSSTTTKNLALKAEHSRKIKKKKVVRHEASDEEDDESISSLLQKTTKLLKALNKKRYDYDLKKKKMVTKKNKSTFNDIKCYNCGDVGQMKRECHSGRPHRINPV